MNFASPYVYDDAADTDIYEVVSDEEFNEGMELSDSDNEGEALHSELVGMPQSTAMGGSSERMPGFNPPPLKGGGEGTAPGEGSILGRFMNRFRGHPMYSASEHTDAGPPPRDPRSKSSGNKKLKVRSWQSPMPVSATASSTEVDCGGNKSEKKKKKRMFRRAHTNVVSIHFDTLKNPSAMHAGEAIFCSGCQGIMSHISQLQEDGPDKVWRCEFCGHGNVVEIEEEEKPTADDVTYLMEPALTTAAMSTSGKDESIVIFCIDTSGSMTITTEVPGSMKLRGSNALQRLARQNSMAGSQRLPSEHGNVTYISRLQSVQAAVDHQLQEMAKEFPDRRIALVTFSSDVCVVGDGTMEEVTVSGEKLKDREELNRIGASLPTPKPIKDTRATLGDKVFALEEGGATALGPALVIALAMASQHSGSKVILCTDGKSNEGVGKVEGLTDDEPQPDEFYETVAENAKSKGVSMSVITIKETDCKLIHLGKLADSTGGQVDIVDPLKLTEEFSNLLADRIIATNVTATFILHRGLYIGHEENEASKETREIGNVRANHEISFEYGVRRKKPAKKSPKRSAENNLSLIHEVPSFMETSSTPQKTEAVSGESGEGDIKKNKTSPQKRKTEPMDTTAQNVDAGEKAGEDAEREIGKGAEAGKDGDAKSDIPSELPFQLQIKYTGSDGTKALRVLTLKKPVTTDRNVAEKDADLALLGVHTERKASELALKGDYSESRGVALMNYRLGWRSSRDSEDKQSIYKSVFSRVQTVENTVLHQQQRERNLYGHTHSDDEDEVDNRAWGTDAVANSSACPVPPAAMKKQLRSADLSDSVAYNWYKSHSASSVASARVPRPPHHPAQNKDKETDTDKDKDTDKGKEKKTTE